MLQITMAAATINNSPSHLETGENNSPFRPPEATLGTHPPRNASSRKEMTCSGTSGAFRRACARSPVFWAPERVWRQGKRFPYQAQLRILRLNVSAVSNGRMARTMRKKTWTEIGRAHV